MAYDDDPDDIESEDQDETEAPPPDAPSPDAPSPDAPSPDAPSPDKPPQNPADPRAGLYAWLQGRAAMRASGQNPYSDITAQSREAGSDLMRNQLLASLQKSANQMGTLGGKAADSSAPEQMAQGIYQAQKGDIQDQLAVAKGKDADIATEGRIAAEVMAPDYRQKQVDALNQRLGMQQQALNLRQQALAQKPQKTRIIDKNFVDPDDPSHVLYQDGSSGHIDKGFKTVKDKSDGDEKTYTEMAKAMTTARGNPNVQRAQQSLTAINNAQELIDTYPDPNNMPSQQAALLAQEINKVATGGVGTEGGAKSLEANTLKQSWANLMAKVGGSPTGADIGNFIKENQLYLNNLKGSYQNVADSYQMNLYNAYKNRLSEDQQDRFKAENPELFARSAAPKRGVQTSSIGQKNSGTAMAAPGAAPSSGGAAAMPVGSQKVIGGKTYIKGPNGWAEQ